MNHTYRLVWNKSLNMLVAVAEFARSKGKSAGGKTASPPPEQQAMHLSGVREGLAAKFTPGYVMIMAALFSIIGEASAQVTVLPVSGVGYTVMTPYLFITLNSNGYIGNGNTAPGIEHDPTGSSTFSSGSDYLTPGSPFEGFYLTGTGSGFTNISANNGDGYITGFGNSGTLTNNSTSSLVDFVWTDSNSAVTLTNEYKYSDTSQNIQITTTITANTNISNLQFLRTTDPDQDSSTVLGDNATSSTNNSIGINSGSINIPASDVACAAGPVRSSLTICMYTNSSVSHQAGVSSGWTTSPSDYLQSAPLNDGNGDYTIGLGFNIGSLTTGSSAVLNYSYLFSADSIGANSFVNLW